MNQETDRRSHGDVTGWKRFWSLDPTVTYLNHGAFGACPLPVLERQQYWRSQLERNPLGFFVRELEPLWDDARRQLGAFVGAPSDQLAFVPNATTGVNAVLRSLSFNTGDELLTTSQEYNASRNALNFVAERAGARVVVAPVPFPIESPSQVIEIVMQHVTSRTRLALFDHITSKTGLIFPIAQLVSQLAAKNIDTLVDGAHAPGQIPLNLQEIGAAYYTANCHKWLSAPKGAAFLYVRSDKQAEIRPLTISHGANSSRKDRSRFHLEFDWTGTVDPTAYLCVPEAIGFLGKLLPGGWAELMEYNHAKVLEGRRLLCQTLDIPDPSPNDMIGSMASLPLPDGCAERLYEILCDEFRIEVAVKNWPGPPKRLMRISAAPYNSLADYERLAAALNVLRDRGDLGG
ncbi:MAG: aminotransferase class V-fold PLP-dependent enzyme [Hormoscilla sp.]